MPVTIHDVATEAGVSVSTVSKVLNNKKAISQPTRDRVREAVRKLNYTPNARAVSFARGNTRNIIYLAELKKGSAYSNPHMYDIMCGVFYSLACQGYTMTLMDISDQEHPMETIAEIIAQKSADGIIIHGSVINQKISDLILSEKFPHIVIGHPDFDRRLCWIDTNHELAGEHAGEYVVEREMFPAAFIAGRKTEFISREREKGFRSILTQHKQRLTKEYLKYTDSTWQEGYKATLELLSLPQRPQAIVCENNALAVGAGRALRDKNISTPEEILFLTFDIYPYTTVIDPPPAVIDINVYDMGMQAGEMILRKISNPSFMIQAYTTLPEMACRPE